MNAILPFQPKKINQVTTEADHQTSVPIRVFQGERPQCKDNVKLGEFSVTGIPPMRAGEPQIDVQFHIDANGILNVNAEDKASGNKGHVTIKAQKESLSPEEIARMLQESEEFAKEDEEWLKVTEAHEELKKYIDSISSTLHGGKAKLRAEEREAMQRQVDEGKDFLDNLNGDKRNSEDYAAKKSEIQDVVDPIFNRMYGGKPKGKNADEEGGEEGGDDEEDWGEHQEL